MIPPVCSLRQKAPMSPLIVCRFELKNFYKNCIYAQKSLISVSETFRSYKNRRFQNKAGGLMIVCSKKIKITKIICTHCNGIFKLNTHQWCGCVPCIAGAAEQWQEHNEVVKKTKNRCVNICHKLGEIRDKCEKGVGNEIWESPGKIRRAGK